MKHLLIFLFSIIVKAQLSTKGRYQPGQIDGTIDNHYINPPMIEFISSAINSTSPFRFAKAIKVSIPFLIKQAIIKDDVLIYKIKIQSPGALSLSFIFNHFNLPPQAELYVYNEQTIYGAFKAYPSNKKSGKFSIAPISGDNVYIEYIAPVTAPEPVLCISHVVYGYKPLAFLETSNEVINTRQVVMNKRKHSGRCNIDILCDSTGINWSKEARAVTVLLTNENQVYCTGVLLNNAQYNGRQLLLTAYHCASPDPETDIVMFNHQRNACNGYNGHVISLDTLHGLRWLAGSDISDYALFEIDEKIPSDFNVYLAGWSIIGQPQPPLVGIHHPNGDFKKLSIYNGSLLPACWSECPRQQHWKVPRWTRGTTEPGSSGSPLFDANHHIVGQLHGGSASCWNKNGYDIYGSLNASWNRGISHFLDPKKQNFVSVDGIFLNDIRQDMLLL